MQRGDILKGLGLACRLTFIDLDPIGFSSILRRMRYLWLVSCLLFALAATVFASPWSRLKSIPFGRNPAKSTQWADERDLGPYVVRSEFPLSDVQDLVQDLGDLQADIEHALAV